MPSRTTLIRSGITVAVLVAAIVAGSLFAQSRRPPAPATIQLSAEQQSKADYDNAMSALSNEATETAIVLLERSVTLDPGNSAAKKQLAALKKSTPSAATPAPNPTTPATKAPDPNAPDPFLGAIELKKLLPKAMEGYSLGYAQVVEPDALIPGEPTAADAAATGIVWYVHDLGSPQAAKAYADRVTRSAYTKNAATVNVRGVTGYFGTDGTRLATVVFSRGRYGFEVILTTPGSPSDVRPLAEIAAAAFPSEP